MPVKNLKYASCLLLVFLFSCFFLVSCKTNGNDCTEVSSSYVSTESEKEQTAEAFPYPNYYNDTTLKILCVSSSRHTYGELQFVPNEESSFTAISEAVRARNDYIEETYGLKIEVYSTQYPVTEVRTYIQSGTNEYDLVCDSVDYMVQSVTENLFWSVDDLLDLNKSWWDTVAMDSISIGDKHYFLCGDALITDDDNTYLYLFNKDMYNDNTELQAQFGDIYQLVRSGGFTLDVFEQMCRMVSHADENGSWGFYATYGNLSHAYGATVMVNGCNLATASADENDYFTLNVGSARSLTVYDKIYQIMSDSSLTQRAELIAGQGSNPSTYGFAELEEMFVNGRGLFYNTTSSSISILKNLGDSVDFEFGVLPIPKYDENQENYCCTVNRYQSSVLGIPITNVANQEATCVLLQALGCYSENVKTAYYEQTLQLQSLTNNDDAEMLDLVYNNRFYDLGAMFNWGSGASTSLINFYGHLLQSGTNEHVSLWESISSAVEADMNATIEAYKNSLT